MRELYDLRPESMEAPTPWQAPEKFRGADGNPPWVALLQRFYARSGRELPPISPLKNEEVPAPYKALLVHSSDMTPTLERFYRQDLTLTVLNRDVEGDSYLREVVLRLAGDGRPVEYGVIHIALARFPAGARRRILEEQMPLGSILESEAIAHLSWPQAFFRTHADHHMSSALGLKRPGELYGRRNVLLDGARHLLAEVIEVLAPVAP